MDSWLILWVGDLGIQGYGGLGVWSLEFERLGVLSWWNIQDKYFVDLRIQGVEELGIQSLVFESLGGYSLGKYWKIENLRVWG